MTDRPTGRSMLVLEDAFAAGGAPVCLEGFLDGAASTDVLSVVYRGRVEDRFDALRSSGDAVGSLAVVAVGPAADGVGSRESAAVRAVPDPADLTGVGMAATEWTRGRDPDRPAVVCVDSLSTILQYADAERAFRFLHALLGQFRTAGVDAHVHMDPAAHDDRTVGQFRQLFDAVRESPMHGESPTTPVETAAGSGGGHAMATDGGETDHGNPDRTPSR